MLQSIYAGISSLQSFQTGIDVLAHNIANVNTTGFRGSTTEFSDLFYETRLTSGSSPTALQVGQGVGVNAVSLDLQTGNYLDSENNTDLAIVGNDGWFGLVGQNSEEYFTRAGSFYFSPDETQSLVSLSNQEGNFVTGTLANNTSGGVLNPPLETLELSSVDNQGALIFPSELTYPVQPSTQADFFGNIGIENLPQIVSATVISPQSERNNLRLVFTQTAGQPTIGTRWDVLATTQTADGSTIYDTQTGVVDFDGSGGLISSTLGPLDNNGASVIPNLGTEFSGLISNSGPSVTSSATVDGNLAGDLITYSVNRNGEVLSNFTNGLQSVVGRVAIYHFQNDQGLESVSGTRFKASANSGDPIFYSQDNGQILAGTLENSNVELSSALTELIVMQRSYDAASKTITTGDEMLKNALQMDG